MEKEKISLKKNILKKIELRHGQLEFIGKKMDELDLLQKYGNSQKSGLSRQNMHDSMRIGGKSEYIAYPTKSFETYNKPKIVDYDVVIYISSFDRYGKLSIILKQLYSQDTKYSFQVIVMNDGSNDINYNNIPLKFSNIHYLKNKTNKGRSLYWETTNTIFEKIRDIETCAVIEIDDDFILCDNFINLLMDKFFYVKSIDNSYMGIRYHIYSFNESDVITDYNFNEAINFQGFDGGSLFDIQFLKMIDYRINEINPDVFKQKTIHSHVWSSLNDKIKELGAKVYRTRESLAFHTGNEDSKMHHDLRLRKKIYTKQFITN